MNDEAGWHNVGIYFYDDERREDLLLDCVRPLFAGFAPRPCFFVRHWLRGPHLRLRLHTTTDDFDRVVRPAIVIVNCCYLHLTRLGIRPFERSLLGFLVSETVEERFGVSAVEMVTAS